MSEDADGAVQLAELERWQFLAMRLSLREFLLGIEVIAAAKKFPFSSTLWLNLAFPEPQGESPGMVKVRSERFLDLVHSLGVSISAMVLSVLVVSSQFFIGGEQC